MNDYTSCRRLIRAGLLSVLVALLATCSEKEAEPQPSDTVQAFYNQLFKIVEENSINRRKIDWADYKAKIWKRVANAKTISETEAAMLLAMSLLKDNHSSIIADNKRVLYGGIGCQTAPAVTPPFTLDNVGYIEVKGFSGSDQEAINFAQAIQNNIQRLDDKNLKGWVIDLRRNTGGGMYPMIAGLGPFIGEGVCGYFYDIDNKPIHSFAYEKGNALLDMGSIVKVDRPYRLINENPKVAILIGGATASSGEATTLAFVGRPNTRFFGTATCGVSTSNTQYTLPFYGYRLNLFTANMGDRTGKIYGAEIVPDEVVTDEQIFDKAVKWISQ